MRQEEQPSTVVRHQTFDNYVSVCYYEIVHN